MKRVTGVSAFILFMTTLVSAQDSLASGLSKGMNQVIGAIEGMLGPFFSAILGGGSGMLFEKVLFLTIILATVYIIVKRMPVFDNKGPIIWIVSISISLLATRFMNANLLQAMLLPYSVLGITLTAVLPLIIFFAFVHTDDNGPTVRKMLWIFYIVVFLSIWGIRYDSVGDIAWIYAASAGVALIFLLADGTIRRAIIKQKMDQLDQNRREDAATEIRKRLTEIESDKTAGHITDARYAQLKKSLEKQLHKVMKF